ncbi:hypothetical protein C8R44DRAFT_726940 [Mycena epipterygia]|nr:hypothetical protein C8R44DRAFT_726940 [Mycena epipterygia]
MSDPQKMVGDDGPDITFAKLFELVRARGYSLFVSVDDYDTPSRTPSFWHLHSHNSCESPETVREIERQLDLCFWRPLLNGSNLIDKSRMLGLQPVFGLEACCGFTEREALDFARSILDEVPVISDLRRSCGYYGFSSQGAASGMVESVLHPKQLMARMSELSLKRPHANNYSFDLLSSILKLLPEESDAPGVVTSNGLIDLLATGAVEINSFDGTAVTWNALHHAGALTYDRRLDGTLRVANSAVLSLIHSHVDDLVSERHDFEYMVSH